MMASSKSGSGEVRVAAAAAPRLGRLTTVTSLNRGELYKMVWQTPVTEVARQLGMAETSLLRACERHRIPRPARGYWRKLETGQPVEKIALPDSQDLSEVVLKPKRSQRATPAARGQSVGHPSSASSQTIEVAARADRPPSGSAPELPDPTDAVALVHQLGGVEEATRFVNLLEHAARDADAATAAVIDVWIAQARASITNADRLANVLAACAMVARGQLRPAWWNPAVPGTNR